MFTAEIVKNDQIRMYETIHDFHWPSGYDHIEDLLQQIAENHKDNFMSDLQTALQLTINFQQENMYNKILDKSVQFLLRPTRNDNRQDVVIVALCVCAYWFVLKKTPSHLDHPAIRIDCDKSPCQVTEVYSKNGLLTHNSVLLAENRQNDNTRQELENIIANLEHELQEKQDSVQMYGENAKKYATKYFEILTELKQKDETITKKDEELAQKDEELAQKDKEIFEKDKEISRKNDEIRDYMSQIQTLKTEKEALQAMKSASMWGNGQRHTTYGTVSEPRPIVHQPPSFSQPPPQPPPQYLPLPPQPQVLLPPPPPPPHHSFQPTYPSQQYAHPFPPPTPHPYPPPPQGDEVQWHPPTPQYPHGAFVINQGGSQQFVPPGIENGVARMQHNGRIWERHLGSNCQCKAVCKCVKLQAGVGIRHMGKTVRVKL